MPYKYTSAEPEQFADFAVELSSKILGVGVQSFSRGKDGGVGALYVGPTGDFPGNTYSWNNITVIQVKHTSDLTASCSDRKFSVNKKSVISDEVAKIKKLIGEKQLDNYLLITNRKLTAGINAKIINKISEETGLKQSSIYLAGIEYLDRMCNKYPELLKMPGLSRVIPVLNLSNEDIAEVINVIHDALNTQEHIPPDISSIIRINYEEKNKKNNFPRHKAETYQKGYLMYSLQIQTFLSNPRNSTYKEYYENSVHKLQRKVVRFLDEYKDFSALYDDIAENIIKDNPVLENRQKFCNALLFYMYWNCDIGLGDNVNSE